MSKKTMRLVTIAALLIGVGTLQLRADGPLPVPTGPNPPQGLIR